MRSITTDEGAYIMIKELQESQPIIGLDRSPVTQYEVVEATRNRADRDDFQEQRNGKARI